MSIKFRALKKKVPAALCVFFLSIPTIVFAGATDWVKIVQIQVNLDDRFYIKVEASDNINNCSNYSPTNTWFELENTATDGAKNIISAAYAALAANQDVFLRSSSCTVQGYNNIDSIDIR